MERRAASLPINILITLIIALVVLAIVLFFYGMITGKHIFPAIIEKIKMALGLWNATGIKP